MTMRCPETVLCMAENGRLWQTALFCSGGYRVGHQMPETPFLDTAQTESLTVRLVSWRLQIEMNIKLLKLSPTRNISYLQISLVEDDGIEVVDVCIFPVIFFISSHPEPLKVVTEL